MKMERKIRAFGMIIPLKQRCMVRETPGLRREKNIGHPDQITF